MASNVIVVSQYVLLNPRMNLHCVEGFLLEERVSSAYFQLFVFDILTDFFDECLDLVEDIWCGKL